MRMLALVLLILLVAAPLVIAQQQPPWWLVIVTDLAIETRFMHMFLGPYPTRGLCDQSLSEVRGTRNFFGDANIRIVSVTCKSQIDVARMILNP